MMKAVLFDLDDTLYARSAPFLDAFRTVFPDVSGYDPASLYHAFLRSGDEVFEASMQGRISMQEMYIYRISHAASTLGLHPSDKLSLQFQAAYDYALAHLHLCPELEKMMILLHQKNIFIGLVTNGPSEHQRIKCTAMQLNRWIPGEQILASGDIGISKPDPRIMQEALRRWNLNPDETWYTGDNYAHDIICSSQAGMHTIWMDRRLPSHGAQSSETVKPDIIVHSEQELLDTIQEML